MIRYEVYVLVIVVLAALMTCVFPCLARCKSRTAWVALLASTVCIVLVYLVSRSPVYSLHSGMGLPPGTEELELRNCVSNTWAQMKSHGSESSMLKLRDLLRVEARYNEIQLDLTTRDKRVHRLGVEFQKVLHEQLNSLSPAK